MVTTIVENQMGTTGNAIEAPVIQGLSGELREALSRLPQTIIFQVTTSWSVSARPLPTSRTASKNHESLQQFLNNPFRMFYIKFVAFLRNPEP